MILYHTAEDQTPQPRYEDLHPVSRERDLGARVYFLGGHGIIVRCNSGPGELAKFQVALEDAPFISVEMPGEALWFKPEDVALIIGPDASYQPPPKEGMLDKALEKALEEQEEKEEERTEGDDLMDFFKRSAHDRQ